MIDTHCHLDLAAFDADRADVIARARGAGIEGVLVPAIRPRTWDALRAMQSEFVAVAFGIHPQIVPELDAAERAIDADAIAAACAAGGGAAAVGECGLDGQTAERALQEQIFRAHVRAARAVKLPLVVHVLGGGHDRALAILRDEGAGEVGGVMHSYSGSAELVRDYAALGFAFSFAGAITRSGAKRPAAAARAVPAELLLVETDAPDQTPSDRRGMRNEPALLASNIAALAAARDEDPHAVALRTAANARSRFARW